MANSQVQQQIDNSKLVIYCRQEWSNFYIEEPWDMLFQSQIPHCFQNTSMHKTKEAPNLSGTNDKDWNSRLWGGSMVIFPVEPHLMVVFNNGSVIPSLDMLQRNESDLVN
jgi:hypothetical protein